MTRAILGAVALVCALVLMGTTADARQRHRGSFNCGIFMSKLTGAPYTPLALEWARKFQRVSAQEGAVVVQRRKGRALGGGPGGHVSRIVSLLGYCRAVVRDNRGTYERDICRNLVAYVMP